MMFSGACFEPLPAVGLPATILCPYMGLRLIEVNGTYFSVDLHRIVL